MNNGHRECLYTSWDIRCRLPRGAPCGHTEHVSICSLGCVNRFGAYGGSRMQMLSFLSSKEIDRSGLNIQEKAMCFRLKRGGRMFRRSVQTRHSSAHGESDTIVHLTSLLSSMYAR